MTRRHTLVALLTIVMASCDRAEIRARNTAAVDTWNILMRASGLVNIAQESGEGRPTSVRSLVEWAARRPGLDRETYIDYKESTIKDAWGREILLMKVENKVVAVGSAGANGRWENGEGDDIWVSIEARRRAGAELGRGPATSKDVCRPWM